MYLSCLHSLAREVQGHHQRKGSRQENKTQDATVYVATTAKRIPECQA